MQAHRLGHLRPEPAPQIVLAARFVQIVHPLSSRVLAEVVHHMPDIVQQGGGDFRSRQPHAFGKQGRLERVLALVDRGQTVLAFRLQGQQAFDFGKTGITHQVTLETAGLCRKRRFVIFLGPCG